MNEFDAQCDAYEIEPAACSKQLARHVSNNVKATMKGMPQYVDDYWEELKERFITSLRSTTLSVMYMLDDLRALAYTQARMPMVRPLDFEEYLRRYRMITQYLTSSGVLTKVEENRIFWSKFTEPTRKRLENVLYRLEPILFGLDLQLKAEKQVSNVLSFDARDRFHIPKTEMVTKRKKASVFLDARERIRTAAKQVVPALIQNGIDLKTATPINNMWGDRVPGTMEIPQKNDQVDCQLGLVLDMLSKLSVGSLQYSTCYQEAVNERFPIQSEVPEPQWARPKEEKKVTMIKPPSQDRNDRACKLTFSGACFYCNLYSHRSMNCELVRDHVKKGWISIATGQVTYPNGKAITGPYGKKKVLIVADHWNAVRNVKVFEVAEDEIDMGEFEVDNREFDVGNMETIEVEEEELVWRMGGLSLGRCSRAPHRSPMPRKTFTGSIPSLEG